MKWQTTLVSLISSIPNPGKILVNFQLNHAKRCNSIRDHAFFSPRTIPIVGKAKLDSNETRCLLDVVDSHGMQVILRRSNWNDCLIHGRSPPAFRFSWPSWICLRIHINNTRVINRYWMARADIFKFLSRNSAGTTLRWFI